MTVLGPNDLKTWAVPTYWDSAYLSEIRLASGETYEEFLNDVTRALAMQNAALLQDPLLSSLVSVTTEVATEYPTGVSNGFAEATEYSQPDAKRASTTGHMLPLIPYDRKFEWTFLSMKNARRVQLDADISSGMADVRSLYAQKILNRLFKSTYDSVASGRSMPVADGGTADSGYVPINAPDRATAFAYTHTHLGCLAGITQANLETQVAHLWEHGYDAPYDLVIAQADVSSWTDVTSVTGFVPMRNAGIDYGASETLAQAAPGIIGVIETSAYGPVRVRANARIPTAYWAVYKSYGPMDQRNPLVIRYNPDFGIGAVLLAGDHIRKYPLESAIMWSELGVGVHDRVAAALCYNTTPGSYTSPTIS